MAKKAKKAKKKKTQKGSAGQDFMLREILGILVVTLAVLSAIALGAARDEATTLYGMKTLYSSLFGVTAFAVPVLLGLLGTYVIWRKAVLMKIAMHVVLAILIIGAMVNIVSPGAGILAAGGGAITASPMKWLASSISAPGAFLILVAITMIYLKLALKISYIEAGKKLTPYIETAGNAAKESYASARKAMDEKVEVAREKKRAQIEELKAKKEKEKEEKALRLQEEEAKRLAEERAAMEKAEAEKAAAEREEEERKKEEARKPANTEPRREPVAETSKIQDLEDVTIPDEDDEEDFFEDDDIEEYDDKSRVNVSGIGDEGEEEIIWKLPKPEDWMDVDAKAGDGVMDDTMRSKLENTLNDFQVPAKISNVVKGASFTRFEIELERGTKVSRVVSLTPDIALSLATDIKTIRVEAPIPGKSAVGIEVPNKERAMVPLSKVFNSPQFSTVKTPLSFVLGEDIDAMPAFSSITKMPHMLVAGSTGSGKSVCLNCIVTNIIAREYPSEVRFIMVDMKRVELTPYEGIPHLLTPVITEAAVAANALRWVCNEMDNRYKTFAEVGARNIDGYNSYVTDPKEKMYRIVFIIDELADLMMVSSPSLNVENFICRIAQLARATGIHLVLATQRPDTKVITGTIKNNIPSRVAFSVASHIDSQTIIGQKGAESLLGRGDMLFQAFGSNKLKRLQGAYVSDEEVRKIVKFWRDQGILEYELRFENGASGAVNGDPGQFATEDEKLYHQALEIVVNTQQASISMIQRRLKIGYNRAANIIEQMEERGVVSHHDGTSRPREVLITSIDG